MDSRSNSTSGLGLPQPGSDMGQLPPIHAPQSFRAPDTAAPHFDAAAPQLGAVAPTLQPLAPSPAPAAMTPPPATASAQPTPAQPTARSVDQDAMTEQEASQFSVAPSEDTDNDFDEEWVAKAREVVARTHNDPYIQSQELGKLKAQYIKLRYNKDVKVEQE